MGKRRKTNDESLCHYLHNSPNQKQKHRQIYVSHLRGNAVSCAWCSHTLLQPNGFPASTEIWRIGFLTRAREWGWLVLLSCTCSTRHDGYPLASSPKPSQCSTERTGSPMNKNGERIHSYFLVKEHDDDDAVKAVDCSYNMLFLT